MICILIHQAIVAIHKQSCQPKPKENAIAQIAVLRYMFKINKTMESSSARTTYSKARLRSAISPSSRAASQRHRLKHSLSGFSPYLALASNRRSKLLAMTALVW